MSDTTSDDGSVVVIDDREKLKELLGRFLDEDDVRELLGDEEALRAVLGRFVTSTGSDSDVTVTELLALAEEFPEPTWEPDRATLLDSLIAVADQPSWKRRLVTGSPWQSGYELTLSTMGALHNLERRRVMVFPDGYRNYRKGSLDADVSDRCEIDVDGDMRVSIGPVEGGTDTGGGNAVANPGLDELTVNGDADVRFEDKTTLISGAINRVWTGPITRVAGMEGVICGGIFARVHAGPCMTAAAVVTATSMVERLARRGRGSTSQACTTAPRRRPCGPCRAPTCAPRASCSSRWWAPRAGIRPRGAWPPRPPDSRLRCARSWRSGSGW